MKMIQKPHAVVVPVPAQGHINPMFKVAKLLHHKGFHVTFVNIELVHSRMLRTHGSNIFDGLPSFRFESIPDGLKEGAADLHTITRVMMEDLLAPFRDLVLRLMKTSASCSGDIPPVTCIVSDVYMGFCSLDVAEELDIPIALLWTHGAAGVMAYDSFHELVDEGYIPLKDPSYLTNGYLDTEVNSIPGMEGIKLKDLPSPFTTLDPDDIVLAINNRAVEQSRRGTAIIVNTFEALELITTKELKSRFPQISTVGPLPLLETQIPDHEFKSLRLDFYEQDDICLEWLDSREPNSVLYINYGSLATLTQEQLIELAWGLANSEQSFLWIIRSNLVTGGSAVLPPEYEAEIKDRALLASWCDQEKVLKHPAIKGFLTHCGWNSVLESICYGVPLICWPGLYEQLTNCWWCCKKWGIGIQLESGAERERVERVVRELMTGEKGKEMKRRIMEWKVLAAESCSPGGSSFLNFEKLVNEVLLSKFHCN